VGAMEALSAGSGGTIPSNKFGAIYTQKSETDVIVFNDVKFIIFHCTIRYTTTEKWQNFVLRKNLRMICS